MTNQESGPDQENTVTILLLGDPGCGKTTFLSRPLPPDTSYVCILSFSGILIYRSRALKQGRGRLNGNGSHTQPELLRDSDQPFLYDIRFSKKSFGLVLYDTACPNQHWSTLKPDVVLLAFDISNRDSLTNLRTWRHDIIRYFQHGQGERIPVMMIGLKRDLRVEGEGIIYPQETYGIAQELRCDRYAECSAVTGELLAETFEDLARLAGMTTTDRGGQTQGGCIVL